MSQKPVTQRAAAEKVVKDIRRATRKQHSAEGKSGSCSPGFAARTASPSTAGARASRRACTTAGRRSLEAGKRRLAGDTARQATSPEVKELRAEAAALKEAVADLTLENRLLKKSMTAGGGGPVDGPPAGT